jgi:hypothetical protein
MILAFLHTPKSIQQTTIGDLVLRLDLPGLCFILGSLICFLLATETAGAKSAWNSPVVIGELVGFILLAAAFGVVEYYSQERAALVPRILRQRIILVSAAYVFL